MVESTANIFYGIRVESLMHDAGAVPGRDFLRRHIPKIEAHQLIRNKQDLLLRHRFYHRDDVGRRAARIALGFDFGIGIHVADDTGVGVFFS